MAKLLHVEIKKRRNVSIYLEIPQKMRSLGLQVRDFPLQPQKMEWIICLSNVTKVPSRHLTGPRGPGVLFFCFWHRDVGIVACVFIPLQRPSQGGVGHLHFLAAILFFCWRQNGFFSGLHQQPQRKAFPEDDDWWPPLTFLLLILPDLFLVSDQLIYIILVWCTALHICCHTMVHMLYYGCQSK